MTDKELKRKSIAEKIKALILKTEANGCSEAEALAAAGLVGKLMFDYDLEMSDIEYQSEPFLKKFVETNSRITDHMYSLINTITIFTDTKSWFNRGSKSIKYYFYGAEKDVDIALYLYDLLNRAIIIEKKSFRESLIYKIDPMAGKSKSGSFSLAICYRIKTRMNEMKKNIKNEPQQNGLMVIDKKSIVDKKFLTLNMKLNNVSFKSNVVISNSAYSEGDKAGGRININQGLNTSNKQSSLRLNY